MWSMLNCFVLKRIKKTTLIEVVFIVSAILNSS